MLQLLWGRCSSPPLGAAPPRLSSCIYGVNRSSTTSLIGWLQIWVQSEDLVILWYMTKSALMWVFNSSIGIGEAVSLTGSGLLEFSVSVSGPCSVFSLSELEGVLPLIEFYPLRVSPDFIVRNCGALAQLRWVLE
ncbi:hypothetical protein F2Q70_00036752 [Brassica cretica]|nr:hypothetical protein F2Q70_00036752 [Brassica cretica]